MSDDLFKRLREVKRVLNDTFSGSKTRSDIAAIDEAISKIIELATKAARVEKLETVNTILSAQLQLIEDFLPDESNEPA